MTDESPDFLVMTTQIAVAYLGRNPIAPDAIPGVLRQIRDGLTSVATPAAPAPTDKPVPAVSIRKSITPDYLVCLEDGKQLKMLKRHLRTMYDLTPEQYRAKWGLADDYPMVAPNYAEQRSTFAKKIGLGRKEPPAPPPAPPAPKGRRKAVA